MIPVLVKNTDKTGKVMPGSWYVRVGKKWRVFSEVEWVGGGVEWVNAQMKGEKE